MFPFMATIFISQVSHHLCWASHVFTNITATNFAVYQVQLAIYGTIVHMWPWWTSLGLSFWCPILWFQVTEARFNGLVQERRNSIANAQQLRLSCPKPSIWKWPLGHPIWVPNLQVSCRDFTIWQGARTVGLALASNGCQATCPIGHHVIVPFIWLSKGMAGKANTGHVSLNQYLPFLIFRIIPKLVFPLNITLIFDKHWYNFIITPVKSNVWICFKGSSR